MSKLSKVFFLLAFLSTVSSIVIALVTKKDFTWQSITLLWICTAYISELRIKNLEDKL
jgi:hypothetical protein